MMKPTEFDAEINALSMLLCLCVLSYLVDWFDGCVATHTRFISESEVQYSGYQCVHLFTDYSFVIDVSQCPSVFDGQKADLF